MIFLFDTELQKTKNLVFNLKQVYGIGTFHSQIICKKLGVSINFKLNDLSKKHLELIVLLIKKSDFTIGNELKKLHFSLFKAQSSVSGRLKIIRKLKGLPVRGQRTHTNAKTSKKIRLKKL